MKLSLVVDMKGCPNRCKHCWLGDLPNNQMKEDVDEFLVNYFRPYFDEIEFYSWLREPDYNTDYRKRFERDKQISINCVPRRFELCSSYLLVRDIDYVKFLQEVGMKYNQLTLFGLEIMTDKYVGRKGAFNEILQATNILLEHGIAPRWQAFINQENKEDIVKLLSLIKELKLEERCKAINKEFVFFAHEGSCDGENMKLYDIRINKDDVPKELEPYMLDLGTKYSEKEICEMLKKSYEHCDFNKSTNIVLNVSNCLDVYFNYTHLKVYWKIGNLKDEAASLIIEKIMSDDVLAIKASNLITFSELIQRYGDFNSNRLFDIDDYKMYLLNKHMETITRY